MSNHTPWTPFAGSGSLALAVALLSIAGALLFFGLRLRHPLVARQPGRFVGASIVVLWLLEAITFLVAITVYVQALIAQVGALNGPTDPITPITALSGLVAFLVILFLTVPSATKPIRPRAFWVAVGSAVVGTIAAPMIFELPFDLIVMGRTHPPTPGALFTLLFFLPLFLVEITSFAMLSLSPFMKLSRATLFLLAGMFLVFAFWALFGFAYPSTPLPFACNAIAKVVAFATAISLFVPQKGAAHAAQQDDARRHASQDRVAALRSA